MSTSPTTEGPTDAQVIGALQAGGQDDKARALAAMVAARDRGVTDPDELRAISRAAKAER